MHGRLAQLTMAPALHYAPELVLQAQGVRAAIFDVDGVLTDGSIYMNEHGEGRTGCVMFSVPGTLRLEYQP